MLAPSTLAERAKLFVVFEMLTKVYTFKISWLFTFQKPYGLQCRLFAGLHILLKLLSPFVHIRFKNYDVIEVWKYFHVTLLPENCA